jgi:Na+/melibiose symporter-like transporter
VDHFRWPWIFLLNLPVGLAAFVWGRFLLPRSEREGLGRAAIDLPGAALMGLFLSCLIVPLTFASEWGWRSGATWAFLSVAPVAFVALVRVERRALRPLVDLALLATNRLFAMANGSALLNYCALYGVSVLTAVHLQLVLGHPARVTGWVMMGQPIMQALLSPLAGRLSDRMGSRTLATGGMVAVAVGMILLATMGRQASLAHAAGALAVVGLGMAAFSAPNTSSIMGCVRKDQLGMAGAFLATMRVTGQALSVALLGGIASCRLGAAGWRHLLQHAGQAGPAADAFAWGYSAAMGAGACLSLLGAWASLTRPRHGEEIP